VRLTLRFYTSGCATSENAQLSAPEGEDVRNDRSTPAA